jgi:NAD(P)-dependent dehydrogenase (short-subunit alcohol dehydrogenase family)
MMLLEGKVALITGAAGGIGRATALLFAEEGADCAVVDINDDVKETAKKIAEFGRRAAWAVFDVADSNQVKSGIEQLRREIGHIDILVNNAGIVDNVAFVRKMKKAAWQREISVNLCGAFHMIQELINPMVERGWGRIINISSFGAVSGLHKQAAYCASKAGLSGLTKVITLEHARDGITCNVILLGLIATEKVMSMPPAIKKAAVAFNPSRRLGETREVGYLVAFLASDRAGFINGAEIALDGGATLNPLPLGSQNELRELFGTIPVNRG